MSTLTNKERIARLKDLKYMCENYSEIFPEIHFDMAVWGAKKGCGTTCCLLGAAALFEPNIDRGLEGLFNRFGGIVFSINNIIYNYPYAAAQDFFGLNFWEARELFSYMWNQGITTPIQMVPKIQILIDKHKKEENDNRENV